MLTMPSPSANDMEWNGAFKAPMFCIGVGWLEGNFRLRKFKIVFMALNCQVW